MTITIIMFRLLLLIMLYRFQSNMFIISVTINRINRITNIIFIAIRLLFILINTI